jgi:hypothetical protein
MVDGMHLHLSNTRMSPLPGELGAMTYVLDPAPLSPVYTPRRASFGSRASPSTSPASTVVIIAEDKSASLAAAAPNV